MDCLDGMETSDAAVGHFCLAIVTAHLMYFHRRVIQRSPELLLQMPVFVFAFTAE